jgi:hypothetical protein
VILTSVQSAVAASLCRRTPKFDRELPKNRMTTLQMLLMIGLYGVLLVVVIYFTRATARRVVGALIGGAAVGFFGLGAIKLCEALGWWKIPFASTPYFAFIFYAGIAITCSPIYLVTWRVARRWGWRGLAVFVAVIAVIGPPRDYLYATTFPKWMVFSPGVAPILADSVTYIGIVLLGHVVMWLVAGSARADRLARQSA